MVTMAAVCLQKKKKEEMAGVCGDESVPSAWPSGDVLRQFVNELDVESCLQCMFFEDPGAIQEI